MGKYYILLGWTSNTWCLLNMFQVRIHFFSKLYLHFSLYSVSIILYIVLYAIFGHENFHNFTNFPLSLYLFYFFSKHPPTFIHISFTPSIIYYIYPPFFCFFLLIFTQTVYCKNNFETEVVQRNSTPKGDPR